MRWIKAISPPQELEGGAHSAPNFNFTSQGPKWFHLVSEGHQPSSGVRSLVPIGAKPSSTFKKEVILVR